MTAPLDQLQRWLLAAVTHPAGVEAGLASDAAVANIDLPLPQLETVVLPSLRMTAGERLAVYHQAYFARLIGALRDFFPCLADTLGDEVFGQFAVAYLQQFPSRSYTLHRLADHFVQFLELTRPADSQAPENRDDDASKPPWTQFWIDIARLELAIDRVFDGPGPENGPILQHKDLAAIPPERWPDVRLRLVPGCELLAFQFPVGRFYTDWKQQRPPRFRSAEEHYAALLRRDFTVRRYDLDRTQYVLLSQLAASRTVGESILAAAEQAEDENSFVAQLQSWFQTWAADQFFEACEWSVAETAFNSDGDA